MNLSLLDDTTFKGQLQQEWLQWRQQERKYLDIVTWWVNYVKRKICYMFINEGKERVRTEVMNENFYNTCVYDVLQDLIQHREKAARLNHLKAKIVRLHNKRLQTITIDTHEPTMFQGESPTLFHLLQMRKQRESRIIANVLDENGAPQETVRGILRTFIDYLKHKYGPIQIEENCVDQMLNAGFRTVAEPWRDLLDRPITLEELKTVVHRGAGNKAPGNDGIGLAFFFKVNWDIIKNNMLALFNQMYNNSKIRDQQKHGLVVCIPKKTVPTQPADYRPITLLNTIKFWLASS